MHFEARSFVESVARQIPPPGSALDVGGRDVNGHVRNAFTGYRWLVLDLVEGPGVDVVADFADWQTDQRFDLILCTEVLEHTPRWQEICARAFQLLKPGGWFVV